MSEIPQLMTLREVSRRYRIPFKTLTADARSGLAPTLPIGSGTERRHLRMTDPLVQEYLETKTRRAGQAEPEGASTPVDPVAEAIEATRRSAARRRGRRAVTR